MTATPPSSTATHVTCWTKGPVRFVQLDRAAHANSYTQPMLEELQRQFDAAEEDTSLRALVITGAGDRTFCAGADRDEIATRHWTAPLNLRSARVFQRLRELPLVTIAAINGAAVGGGMELALACDFRIAAASARFWLPEPELGLLPAAGGTELLPQLVGVTRAKELILAGATWTAEEAQHYGLVSEVAADGELLDVVDGWCRRIAGRDRLAVQLAKQALQHSESEFARVAQALLVRTQRETYAADNDQGRIAR